MYIYIYIYIFACFFACLTAFLHFFNFFKITEVGTMNIFIYLENENGG